MSKRKHHSHRSTTLGIVRPGWFPLIIYSLGQMGWSLAAFSVGNLLVYFYMPPEQGEPLFPTYIYQGPVLGIFTLVGLVSAAGRVLDAFVDPLIANWSDRKESVLGKRRWFLLIGALPFALLGYWVFTPPYAVENGSNFAWLMFTVGLYYFFFAFYVIPFTALIAELGHDARSRLRISTMISVAWALGFMLGNSAYALHGYFEAQGLDSTAAFQRAVLLLQLVALILMWVPAFFLNERRYARQVDSNHKLGKALRIVLRNESFVRFLKADVMYWLSLTFIQLGIGYYTTVLLGLDKGYAFNFSLVSFLVSFVFYWPVNRLAGKYGKHPVMLAGFLFFSVVFVLVTTVRAIPLPKEWLLYGLGVFAAFPIAVFGILPNALVGDLVEQQERQTSEQLSGMFYGVRAFAMKAGIALANLVFPSLLLFGKSMERPLGVQLTALAAVLFCYLGWQVFRPFKAPQV